MNKTLNNYAEQISEQLYTQTPKAVLAALVVSLLTNGGDNFEGLDEKIVAEWSALHVAGIVPQKPAKATAPVRSRALLTLDEYQARMAVALGR